MSLPATITTDVVKPLLRDVEPARVTHHVVRGGFCLKAGHWLAEEVTTQHYDGHHCPVVRRLSGFPARQRLYFDATKYGSGFIPLNGSPGGVSLGDGLLLDLVSGRITRTTVETRPATREECRRWGVL